MLSSFRDKLHWVRCKLHLHRWGFKRDYQVCCTASAETAAPRPWTGHLLHRADRALQCRSGSPVAKTRAPKRCEPAGTEPAVIQRCRSVLGPHGIGNHWCPAGRSGHDGHARTAGHTASTVPTSADKVAWGWVRAPPPAPTNLLTALWGGSSHTAVRSGVVLDPAALPELVLAALGRDGQRLLHDLALMVVGGLQADPGSLQGRLDRLPAGRQPAAALGHEG
jgi:hypothetical protein